MSADLEHDALGCPRCGLANAPDAVFCANPGCHKALGEFPYVSEEVDARTTWLEALADRVAYWVGQPHFVTIHVLWFSLWTSVNGGLLGARLVFDAYPYGLLGIILAIEAALVTSLLLISNNRQNRFESKRAELEYLANIASFRLLQSLSTDLARLRARVAATEAVLADGESGGHA